MIEKKHIKGFLAGSLISLSLAYIPTLKAQSSPSLSGQYGCLVNKNFAGYDAHLNGAKNVGYNYMLYLDFTNKTSQLAAHLISNFNQADVEETTISSTQGSLDVKNGDITNSHKVTSTIIYNNKSLSITINAMSVNSGNTLLVSSGTGGSGDSTPFNGVCTKV